MREVPDSLNACQHEFQTSSWIDVTKAKQQLTEYRKTLESIGLIVDLLPADNAYPDCCFIEDTAVLIEETSIICRTGAISRRGEVDAVRKYLIDRGYEILEMTAPAELDGGDVLQIESELFVGISRRTNRAGFEVVAEVARRHGRRAFPIEVRNALHLKSVITSPGQGTVIGSINDLGEGRTAFERFQICRVDHEIDAANVSLVNQHILVPANC